MVGDHGGTTVVVVMCDWKRFDADDETVGGRGDRWMLWHTMADFVCVLMDGVDVAIALIWWMGDWFDHLGGAITSDA